MAIIALLVGLGVVLHRLEALLPLPTPWVKLGLANIMTLIALVFLGFRAAVEVTLLRVLLGSVLGGTFLSPTFFLSLAGGLTALCMMGLLYRKRARAFSLVGISVAAAYAHTTAIFICVYFLFIHQSVFFNLLPVFLTFSLVSGILTGLLANNITKHLSNEGISL
jgi:heptaprenyl diphosphate synthase